MKHAAIPMGYLALATLLGSSAMAQSIPLPTSDPDARAAEMVRQMTVAERRDLLLGRLTPMVPAKKRPADVALGVGYSPGVARLNLPSLSETDAGLGVANITGQLRAKDVATALPSGPALAATWNPDLAEASGRMIGSEARAKGFNVLLAGGANLVRDPRGGRTFEYFGEDVLLTGIMAGRSIRGVQSNAILSTVKHFALNAQETGRDTLSVEMGEAAMRESDLLAFQLAIELGKPASVMCSYNRIGGVYACENSFLLNDVLRRDWGYKGFVMSDWGAVHSVSLRAGLDRESGTKPSDTPWLGGAALDKALADGSVTQADIDRAALRIVRSMYAVGAVDAPVKSGGAIDYDANGRIAQQVAEQGIVLLKNERGLLPIAKTAKRILLVGGHADIGVLAGAGSSQVAPVGGPALWLPVPGQPVYIRRFYMPSSPQKSLQEAMPGAVVSYDDGTDPARAAAAARGADLVVVFGEQFSAEGSDVRTLDLPDGQNGLIDTVARANPKTVVVLETNGAVLMPWLDKVGAVVAAWYPGQHGGRALARILSGAVNPSGRLPLTFPRSVDQLPAPTLPGSDLLRQREGKDIYDMPAGTKFDVRYPEGADVGYRWFDRRGQKPLFAFGHGLSYTRFTYDRLRLDAASGLTATFRITNAGARDGAEIAPVYAQIGGSRRVVGWVRAELKAGESRTYTVTAEPRLLASFDTAAKRWVIAAGSCAVDVGGAVNEPKLRGTVRLASRQIAP